MIYEQYLKDEIQEPHILKLEQGKLILAKINEFGSQCIKDDYIIGNITEQDDYIIEDILKLQINYINTYLKEEMSNSLEYLFSILLKSLFFEENILSLDRIKIRFQIIDNLIKILKNEEAHESPNIGQNLLKKEFFDIYNLINYLFNSSLFCFGALVVLNFSSQLCIDFFEYFRCLLSAEHTFKVDFNLEDIKDIPINQLLKDLISIFQDKRMKIISI